MKRILFLIFLVFSFGVYSQTFSEADKKEILKQFSELQKAVKKRDAAAISNYISYPLKDGNTNEIKWRNSSDLSKDLKNKNLNIFNYVDELKVDYTTNSIINIEDRVLRKGGDYGDELLSVTGSFLDTDDLDGTIYSGLKKPHFVVVVSEYDEMTEGGTYYLFSFNNKQLKLVSFFQLP
jgi:uncharacterized protein YheU (UPF0270 family)